MNSQSSTTDSMFSDSSENHKEGAVVEDPIPPLESEILENTAVGSKDELAVENIATSQITEIETKLAVNNLDKLLPLPRNCEVIGLKDFVGRKFVFPLHRVKSWKVRRSRLPTT